MTFRPDLASNKFKNPFCGGKKDGLCSNFLPYEGDGLSVSNLVCSKLKSLFLNLLQLIPKSWS